jgi:hypothetical protein
VGQRNFATWFHRLKGEDGQASFEYVAALAVLLVVTLALGGLYRVWRQAGRQSGSPVALTFGRAPYSAPTAGEVNAQCLKDVLMH